jgi:hypothetical protein
MKKWINAANKRRQMRIIILLMLSAMVTACSTMQPPRYSVSVDNIQALKKYKEAKTMVSSVTQSASFSSACRLMGPIEPADGLTFSKFIQKAFNDELKMADIYSEKGTRISGDIRKVVFSSSSGLTTGYWDIAINFKSSNGSSLDARNKYVFESGFDAVTACNATADALSPAVQDLISSVIASPDFGRLILPATPEDSSVRAY